MGWFCIEAPSTATFGAIRWPKPSPKVTSLQALNAVMNEQREGTVRLSLSFMESRLIGAYNKYLDFSIVVVFDSKNTLRRPQRPSGSLEAVCGSYYVYSGSFNTESDDSHTYSRHMSEVPTAAFERLFQLHYW